MKKMFNQGWFWLLAAVLFLLIIQVSFTFPAPYKWMEATWGAGDLISFAGTMILGYIAIYQTEQANLMSEKLMTIEENQYKTDIQPFVVVADWKGYELNTATMLMNDDRHHVCIGSYENGKALGVGIRLLNTTSSYVIAEYFRGDTEGKSWFNSCVNQWNRKLYIKPGDSEEIIFYASENYITALEDRKSTIYFILENRFGQRYIESFGLYITYLNPTFIFKENEIGCSATVQDYKIVECSNQGEEHE